MDISLKGNVFNIQRFSITDGVGIRTLVFMKGCPLRCVWCSNPESQRTYLEIMDVKTNCIGCGKCVDICPEGAIDAVSFDIDRQKCSRCGKCADYCFANAKKTVGKKMTIPDVMKIIDKDRIFYRNSSGGVTIGGGEPTAQAKFVSELLKRCKVSNIHTAVETCGYGEWERIKDVFQYTDQIFFDIKSMDADNHKKLTGVGNELILDNAIKVSKLGKKLTFRMPVIPGLNDGADSVENVGVFVKGLLKYNDRVSLELLPYHDFGRDKYRWLSLEYTIEDTSKADENTIMRYRKYLTDKGVPITI